MARYSTLAAVTHKVLIAVAAVLAASALSACRAPSTASGATSAPGVAIHTGDLRSYLLAVPAGATAEPVGDDGTITLDEDAATTGNPAKRKSTLLGYGFKGEAGRAWSAAGGSEVEIVLIQFDSPVNAGDYITDAEGSSAVEFSNFPVAALPGADVFIDPTTEHDGSIEVEGTANEGDVAILIFDTQKTPGSPDAVATLLRAQHDALLTA